MWQQYQQAITNAEIEFLQYLKKQGYVFEQFGSYESTQYFATHPDVFLTEKERWDSDDWDCPPYLFPEQYPEGHYIELTFECNWLSPDRCYLGYF